MNICVYLIDRLNSCLQHISFTQAYLRVASSGLLSADNDDIDFLYSETEPPMLFCNLPLCLFEIIVRTLATAMRLHWHFQERSR